MSAKRLTSDATVVQAIARIERQPEALAVAEEEMSAQSEEIVRQTSRAETAIARYRVLFELCPDALFVTDPRGIIYEANVAAGVLLEIAPHYLQGKPLPVFVAGVSAVELRSMLGAFNRKVRPDPRPLDPVELRITIRGRRGREVPATMRAVPNVEPDRVFWSVHVPLETNRGSIPPPITELEFERLVAERTHELEESLETVSSELDAARSQVATLSQENEDKDRSLAVVSHELRAPMQAILGWTTLLREGTDAVTAERGLRVIERNARAQADLVANLFEHSRLVADRALAQVDVDVCVPIADAIENIRPQADGDGVALVAELPTHAWIRGDELAVARIAANLLANAVRHCQRGGRVAIRVEEAPTTIELVVDDDGEGIEPRLLERVFERFEQGGRRHHGGLGLGLYLVRALATRLGGEVCAESAGEGKGATFRVTLPRLCR